MSCTGLVSFNYGKNFPKELAKQDAMGYIGALLCKPLALACGTEVTLSSSASGLTFLTAEKRSAIQRIFFAFVAIALLPLTLIGLMCLGCSKAHSSTYGLYSKNGVKPAGDSETEDKTDNVAKVAVTGKTASADANQTKILTPLVAEADLISHDTYWTDKITILGNLSEQLKALKEKWVRSVAKEDADKELHSSISKFNDEAFATLKKSDPKLENPRDFLLALKRRVMAEPVRICDEHVQLEEGSYYILDGQVLKKITDLNLLKTKPVYKFEKGQIELFVSKDAQIDFCVNDKNFPALAGLGIEKPHYSFKEGDVITTLPTYDYNNGYPVDHDILHLFTVGPRGVIFAGKASKAPSSEARAQTLNFNPGKKLKYTTKENAAEIEMSKKLVPGFAFPAIYSETSSSRPCSIVVDIDRDPIFRKLVDYFKKEFELLKEQPDLKIFRLAMFAADLDKKGDRYRIDPLKGRNFYLGDLVNSGKMNKIHYGLLVKALADQLEIPCGLVVEFDERAQEYRTWNVFDMNGEPHVLDSNKMVALSITNPPAFSSSFQAEFGTTGLAAKE
jgi:hypothetical protein